MSSKKKECPNKCNTDMENLGYLVKGAFKIFVVLSLTTSVLCTYLLWQDSETKTYQIYCLQKYNDELEKRVTTQSNNIDILFIELNKLIGKK